VEALHFKAADLIRLAALCRYAFAFLGVTDKVEDADSAVREVQSIHPRADFEFGGRSGYPFGDLILNFKSNS
jgi:hypothetical protein